MKKLILFSLIFFAKYALSQVNDNFDDGNFSGNPGWTGSNSSTDFTILNGQLRSNSAIVSSNFYLSTANALANNCIWEFYCSLQFATSGSNYVDIYLISDQQNLQATNINGYFVRVGNTNDEIALYKRSGAASTSTKIIDGIDASVSSTSNNRIHVRVTRSASNVFTLERDLTGTGTSYTTEGSVTDASFINSSWFGFLVQQSTASFFQKHFFDDISIKPIVTDTTPPQLLSVSVLSETYLELIFDEPLEDASAKTINNYSINTPVISSISIGTDPAKVILTISNKLRSGNYTVTVQNVKDKNNNTISINNTASFSYTEPYTAKVGDIVINEIFADPSPQIDLPTVEYVELWNTSSEIISLQNWKYSDPTATVTLPAYNIQPNEYLILCAKADTAEFKSYGHVLGISPWPSLNNSGDVLKLKNQHSTLIDSVAFKDSWYKNNEKKAGGWALEMIDEKAYCKEIQNWSASIDASGGTPGGKNSIYHLYSSIEILKVKEAHLLDSNTVYLSFNKVIDSLSAVNVTGYTFNNGLSSPVSAKVTSPGFVSVELKFSKPITRGKTYRVEVTGVADCSGLPISTTNNAAEFTYPDRIENGKLLISELLFNPRPEGADFVEIYNNSDVAFDVSELSIATVKADTLNSIKKLIDTQFLLPAKSYLAISTDAENIKKEYHTGGDATLLQVASIPSFNDDAGVVVLLSGGKRIDELSYNSKMHFPLIKDTEGISLERVSVKRATNEPGNFRSAAAAAGFATPGYQNSQNIELATGTEEVALASKTFSPDNDGFEDALIMNYNFSETGLTANASVYNNQGILVRKLSKNTTLSSSGAITWDGTDENGNKASVGIYVVYLEIFDVNGKVRKFKKSCVLAAKM